MAKQWFPQQLTNEILQECINRKDKIAGIEPTSILKIGMRDGISIKALTGTQTITVMIVDLPLWLYLKLGHHCCYRIHHATVLNIVFRDPEVKEHLQSFWRNLFAEHSEMQNCILKKIRCNDIRMRISFGDDGQKTLCVDQELPDATEYSYENSICEMENGLTAARSEILDKYRRYPLQRDLSNGRNQVITRISEALQAQEDERFGCTVSISDAKRPSDSLSVNHLYYSPLTIHYLLIVPEIGSATIAVTLPPLCEYTDLTIDGKPYCRKQKSAAWPDLAGHTLRVALNRDPEELLTHAKREVMNSNLNVSCYDKIRTRLTDLPLIESLSSFSDLLLRMPAITVPFHFGVDWETGDLTVTSSVATIFYSPKSGNWTDRILYSPTIQKLGQVIQDPEMKDYKEIVNQLLIKYDFAGDAASATIRRKCGKGLLLGDALIVCHSVKNSYCMAGQEFHRDMSQMTPLLYGQQLDSCLSFCRTQLDQQMQSRKDRIIAQAEVLTQHPLDAAVFSIVAANKSYITSSKAAGLLRGTYEARWSNHKNTSDCGKLHALSEQEIKHAANRLRQLGYLYYTRTYESSYLLELTRDGGQIYKQLKEMLAQEAAVPDCTLEAITQTIMSYRAFLNSILEKERAGESILPEIICIIHSLGNREYTAYFEEEITSLLAKVSDIALPLLKMQLEDARNIETQKIIRRIATKTRKKVKEGACSDAASPSSATEEGGTE